MLSTLGRLAGRVRSPSTGLILSEICEPRSAAARSLHQSILAALERLHAAGQISCVSHRGTRRWQVLDGDTSTAPHPDAMA